MSPGLARTRATGPAAPVAAAPRAATAPVDEAVDLEGAAGPALAAPRPAETRASFFGRLAGDPAAWVYAAVGVVVLGFAVIAFTWGRVAGETQLARQLPFVVSGGLSGLGLVFLGVAMLVVHAWRVESDRQLRELQRIRAIVARLAEGED